MLIKKTIDRRTFIKFSAIAGAVAGTPLYTFLEWRLANAASTPLRAAMSNAGLMSSWNVQGKQAAAMFGEFLGVSIDWFDGEHDDQKQRSLFEQIATQKYDFV